MQWVFFSASLQKNPILFFLLFFPVSDFYSVGNFISRIFGKTSVIPGTAVLIFYICPSKNNSLVAVGG